MPHIESSNTFTYVCCHFSYLLLWTWEHSRKIHTLGLKIWLQGLASFHGPLDSYLEHQINLIRQLFRYQLNIIQNKFQLIWNRFRVFWRIRFLRFVFSNSIIQNLQMTIFLKIVRSKRHNNHLWRFWSLRPKIFGRSNQILNFFYESCHLSNFVREWILYYFIFFNLMQQCMWK